MARGPEINVDIAEKRFAALGQPLFQYLRFTVAPSSVVALVGASGVGKSTLLRMIAGVDTDFSGSITINGVPADAAPPAGFVFQDPRLLPWLSAVDNIRAVAPQATRADALALLQQVELGSFGDAFPHQLSGGMQRRVGLARALSVNRHLLLLDEPFVSLDRILVNDLQALFTRVFDTGDSTVLIVTHFAEDAALLADRAVVIAGRPVHVAADVVFDTPRGRRDAAELQRLARLLNDTSAKAAA